jgi:hypothetical protein
MDEPTVLLTHDATTTPDTLQSVTHWLSARNYPCRLVAVPTPSDGGADDGLAVADLEKTRQSVGRPCVLVGLGSAATTGLIACGVLPGIEASVLFHPTVFYPTLSERRPTQPLDLLPGRTSPLLVHFGVGAEDRHVALLERRLGTQTAPWQVVRYGGTPGELADPQTADGRIAWRRVERFLSQAVAARTKRRP